MMKLSPERKRSISTVDSLHDLFAQTINVVSLALMRWSLPSEPKALLAKLGLSLSMENDRNAMIQGHREVHVGTIIRFCNTEKTFVHVLTVLSYQTYNMWEVDNDVAAVFRDLPAATDYIYARRCRMKFG